MKMKKGKMVKLLGLALSATLMMSSPSNAAQPGEGAYAGAFLGFGTGILQAKVTALNAGNNSNGDTGGAETFETDRGGLGLSGMQGGGWIGWGMKTADDLYFGVEGTIAGSDEEIKLTSTAGIQDDGSTNTITSIKAHRNWVGGGAVRVGYYVNKETLLALSGGVAISQFDVDIGGSSETYYAGGPQFGASLTTNLTKIDPNLGLRMDFVYTDYLTADISGQDGVRSGATTANGNGNRNNSELTGHDTAARIGVTYRFNSLF